MKFNEKVNKAYKTFNGYQENLMSILIDMLEKDDLEEFGHWLNNDDSISDYMNYKYYNEAFEKVYGHPAFDEDGNCYE